MMNQVTKQPNWIRKGECNNCGYCCRFPFDPLTLFFPKGDPLLEQFLKIRGFVEGHSDGQRGQGCHALAYQKCPHHIGERCDLWAKPERPQLCHDFPSKPSQVVSTPCSYWFEDVDGLASPIGGEASPFPSKEPGFTEKSSEINPPSFSVGHEGMVA